MVGKSSGPMLAPPVPNEWTPLDPRKTYRGRFGPYILDSALCNAANTAYVLGRPLLLTGEPGCGKTDFAWVMAHACNFRPTIDDDERSDALPKEPVPWEPLQCHVRSDMTSRDLLYRYDALLRFVDTNDKSEESQANTRNLARYFELRGLGKALVWPRAERPVLLIDEIDKAPRDLPNALLQALDVGEFEVAELREDQPEIIVQGGFGLRRAMGTKRSPDWRPFVVITSNVEQRLPEPFLRRCVFFHIEFPTKQRLVEIVRNRRPAGAVYCFDELLIEQVVDVFLALRDVSNLAKKPATAELLDWTEALVRYWNLGSVAPWLDAFAGRVHEHQRRLELREDEGEGPVRWCNLPGVECLLKLRDDLDLVGAVGRG